MHWDGPPYPWLQLSMDLRGVPLPFFFLLWVTKKTLAQGKDKGQIYLSMVLSYPSFQLSIGAAITYPLQIPGHAYHVK